MTRKKRFQNFEMSSEDMQATIIKAMTDTQVVQFELYGQHIILILNFLTEFENVPNNTVAYDLREQMLAGLKALDPQYLKAWHSLRKLQKESENKD